MAAVSVNETNVHVPAVLCMMSWFTTVVAFGWDVSWWSFASSFGYPVAFASWLIPVGLVVPSFALSQVVVSFGLTFAFSFSFGLIPVALGCCSLIPVVGLLCVGRILSAFSRFVSRDSTVVADDCS